MSSLGEYADEEIFDEYERRVHSVAVDVASLFDEGKQGAVNLREWCDENDVPETAAVHAVENYTEGLTWGVSPLHPFPEGSADEVSASVHPDANEEVMTEEDLDE